MSTHKPRLAWHNYAVLTQQAPFEPKVIEHGGKRCVQIAFDFQLAEALHGKIRAKNWQDLPASLQQYMGSRKSQAVLHDMAGSVTEILSEIFPAVEVAAVTERPEGNEDKLRVTFRFNEPQEAAHMEALLTENGIKPFYHEELKPAGQKIDNNTIPDTWDVLLAEVNTAAAKAARHTTNVIGAYLGTGRG